MSLQSIITLIVVLTAAFAYLNTRFIKWPPTIGVMALSLLCSLLLAIFSRSNSLISADVKKLIVSVDFEQVLMDFMLSFLLFAGAIHLNAQQLKVERWPVLILATLGTVLSTFLIGILTWYLFMAFKLSVPFIHCLLFGALISPTDPIAVLGILKTAKINPSLETTISGESLFNDGIAVVIFATIATLIQSTNSDSIIGHIGHLLLIEAGGGLVLGTVIGYTGYWLLSFIDDYKVEVLMTLAMVTGGYYVAQLIHTSGPLAMVIAGLITGNKSKREIMSSVTRDYLNKFWELLDEILNAILFLLMGLEMLIIKFDITIFYLGLISILLVLVSRWIAVALPMWLLKNKMQMEKHAAIILTWGGLRGGLSIAMALSIQGHYHNTFLLITYIIVVFSVLIQGLTIGTLAKKLQ